MKSFIVQRALELGFDACRFTTAAPPQSAPQFQHWLDARQHGDMDYLRRTAHKRVDPKQVLPGAQSIICVAASYESFRFDGSGSKLDSSVVSSPSSVAESSMGPSRNLQPATRLPAAPLRSAAQAGNPQPAALLLSSLDAFRPLSDRAPEPQIAEAQRREFFAQLHRWLRQSHAVHVFCNNEGERQRFQEIWDDYGFGKAGTTNARQRISRS